MATNDRMQQFKTDVADLKLKTGGANRETAFQVAGLVLMVAGAVVALVTYSASLSQSSIDVQSGIILAVAMLTLAVVGAAVFLRYSLAKFLRIWLLRQMYENQAHVDQVVEAVLKRDA